MDLYIELVSMSRRLRPGFPYADRASFWRGPEWTTVLHHLGPDIGVSCLQGPFTLLSSPISDTIGYLASNRLQPEPTFHLELPKELSDQRLRR